MYGVRSAVGKALHMWRLTPGERFGDCLKENRKLLVDFGLGGTRYTYSEYPSNSQSICTNEGKMCSL